MKIGGGSESWMVVLPVCGLAVLVMVYAGGPSNALESLERIAENGWNSIVVMLRR